MHRPTFAHAWVSTLPKKLPISVISPVGYFFYLIFFDDLQLQIIESISSQSICKEFISPVGYFYLLNSQYYIESFN